jgi:hypothetical protein
VGQTGLPITEGDTIQLGPFTLTVAIDRALMVADDLDRTVFGTAFVNPFRESAREVAGALAALRQAYADLDYGHRAEALRDALHEALGGDAEALGAVVLGQVGAPAPHVADAPAAPRAEAPASPPADAPAADADVLHALASVAARLVSIPGQFRHEFLGHTVVHAPETAFLFDADVQALVAHLTPADASARAGRHALLSAATEAVLRHHQALLEGYRAAVRDGAAVLLDAVDPDALDAEGGLAGGLMPGARERALLDRVRQRVTDLRGESFAATERRVYRPAFTQAYLDSLARMASGAAAPAAAPDPAAPPAPAGPAEAFPYPPPAGPASHDPFAAPSPDPFAMPASDPYAAPAHDPYAAPASDPYAAPAPTDPYAAPTHDPFAAPASDPYVAPTHDPYGAPPSDPFAAPSPTPYAAPASDPFAAPAPDPFDAPSPDPFAAPPPDPFADPFATPPPDPFAPPPRDP